MGFEFFDDAEAFGVGEAGFEAVADFDAHFAVLDEDEEDGAVVFVFEAGAPGLEEAVGVVFDAGVGLHLGVDGDQELVGGVALELGERFVELGGDGGGDDVGCVVEEGFGGRGDDFGGVGADGEPGEEQAGEESGHSGG